MQTVSNDITVAEEAAEANSLSLTPTNIISTSSVYNWVALGGKHHSSSGG